MTSQVSMRLNKAASLLDRVITLLSRRINIVGASFLVVMMLITVADVTGRYIFLHPVMGALEISAFIMVIIIFLGAAYTQVEKGHIRVELLVSLLPEKILAVVWSSTYFLSLSFFSVVAWQSVITAKSQMLGHETSTVLLIPTWPFVLVVAFGSALLSLVFLADLVKSLSQAVRK